MKVFLTNQLFSHGIKEIDIPNGDTPYLYQVEGCDWHMCRDAAVSRANNIVASEIKKHQEEIKRLKKFKF